MLVLPFRKHLYIQKKKKTKIKATCNLQIEKRLTYFFWSSCDRPHLLPSPSGLIRSLSTHFPTKQQEVTHYPPLHTH